MHRSKAGQSLTIKVRIICDADAMLSITDSQEGNIFKRESNISWKVYV